MVRFSNTDCTKLAKQTTPALDDDVESSWLAAVAATHATAPQETALRVGCSGRHRALQTHTETMSTAAPYAIAPDYAGKFKPSAAKEILSAVLNEKLQGKEFSADLTTQWTKEIADEVKTRLKGEPTEPAAACAACFP